MTRKHPKYINRELSWLEFNRRVLDEARDSTNPLLERLRFLAITSSNLDEFFMVRVGGLQLVAAGGGSKPDPAGMTPEEQLQAISERTHELTLEQYHCYLNELEPKLESEGVRRVRSENLSSRQLKVLEQLFENEIFSILTPMAVRSIEEFPLLINQTMNVCVQLSPQNVAEDESDDKRPRFAIIPFGRSISRFITLPSEGGYEYILLEDVVGMFIEQFFPGEDVIESVPFRITRNADMSVREDLASDLLSEMQELLDARKQSDCVRLEISDCVTSNLMTFLQTALGVDNRDVYASPGPLDLSAFTRLAELKGFDHLKNEPWPPQPSPAIDSTVSMFDVLSRRDVVLYHPYESFDPVLRLISEAVDDPDVLAIKQILYRTSRNSPVVAALIRAAQRGKHVTAIVELKARFDEARNIEWAKNLEQEGVQVFYGVKGLKTHAKLCIIIRREPHGIQRYIHFGTGNYNEITARLYSDASYMTCDEELGADAISFFNTITGYSQPQIYRRLEAAPTGLRERLLEMIETETERKRQGQDARIIAKLNSLVDPQIIDALYTASQAGVGVDLNIRGICCLRPGVKKLSKNINVVSIIDRFLEHARIFYFHHGGDERVFISSADWMPRNLDRRVELLVPVDDPVCRSRLVEILKLYFQDTVKARQLLADGSYEAIIPEKKSQTIRSQEVLYRQARNAVKEARQSQRSVFEPHQAPMSESGQQDAESRTRNSDENPENY